MTFEVDTSSLESTIKSMDSEMKNIVDTGNRLYAALEALDRTWRGQAHDVFSAQYEADQQRLEELCEFVSDVIDGLEMARKKYDNCEQSVKNKISRISI